MKDYSKLFNELWTIDIGNCPFNERDWDLAHLVLNLHRHCDGVDGDENRIFLFIGTEYSVKEFAKDYKRRHKKYAKMIGDPVLLKSLI